MDKIALVTGSSSGIGELFVLTLLDQGFFVIGGCRSECEIDHENFLDLSLDVTNEKSVKLFFKEIESHTEVIDVFIDCAGVCDQNSLRDTSINELSSNLSTNSIGTFLVYKEFENFIIEDETIILSILPIAAKKNYEFTLAYSASQSAKKSIIDSIKKEWKKYQVQFTSVFLGPVNTPIWEDFDEVEADKMIQVEELASFLKYVLSKSQVLNIDEITLNNKYSLI